MINEPLGLPEGTVRAIIAIILIVSVALFLYLGVEIPEWYYALLISYVGYYIGTRTVSTTKK